MGPVAAVGTRYNGDIQKRMMIAAYTLIVVLGFDTREGSDVYVSKVVHTRHK